MSKTVNYNLDLGELELALDERKLGKDELHKKEGKLLGGELLRKELEDTSKPDVDKSLHITLKPHGIYIQFDRALIKESIREWTFMVRDTVWGGGDIPAETWLEFSKLADLYSKFDDGSPSLRLTTRENFQFHRVSKQNLVPLIRRLIELGSPSLNGCGDNARNPVACPHKSNIFDANALAKRIGKYFQLPLEGHYEVFKEDEQTGESNGFNYSEYGMPRKFKIGIGGYYFDEETGQEIRCNCCDILTNDVAVAPIIKDKRLKGYQVYIGGGLGQKNGKATFPSLAGSFGVFTTEDDLIKGLDAIARVFQQVGDRKHRHWARLKNILIAKGLEKSSHTIESVLLDENIFKQVRNLGIEWYRQEVKSLGVNFLPPEEIELGKVGRHHGWHKEYDGKWSFGLWIQNGRISDSNPQGKIKSLIDEIVSEIKPTVRIQATQDLLFLDIPESLKNHLEEILKKYNYGNYSKLKINSEACVGLYTCPLAVAESEKYFHPLISELEKRGYSDLDGVSIGISGCERHCSRNVRYGISLEGKGDSFYQLKLLLGKTDDEHLARDLVVDEKKYLRLIPRESVPDVISVLIDNYKANKKNYEKEISQFHQRIGIRGVIEFLKKNEKTAELLDKTYDPYLA
jgi:sulfite reductase beta subunit-like hemoprotein